VICPACDHDNIAGVDLCENCGLDLAGLDVTAWGVDPEDPLLAVSLGDLPLKRALTLASDALVSQAIEAMRDEQEGCVFVEDAGGGLVGVFTERDVTTRIAARGRNPAKTRLEEVMTRNPVALLDQDPLAWALHRMGVDGHRHLPVLNDRGLAGLLSSRVVLRAFLDA
jgi:CBS domain-containing protein